MTLIADRYQPLDPPRPGVPQRARDLQTAQTVLLREVRMPDADALARAQAARGVFHPSLVTLFEVIPHPDGRALLAYEYVTAHPIAQVSGGRPLNARRAAQIVSEVADALAELHARDIPHGGVSQQTVLVTMKGKAKLDRVGDPTLNILLDPSIERDLIALGELLDELAARPGGGASGNQAVETIVSRARAGQFESAATIASLLRRASLSP